MKAKKQNQSMLMKIINSPLKALSKARDLYVKSMKGCSTRPNYGPSSMPNGELPTSYSIGSAISLSSNGGGGDDYAELLRAASVRSLGHKNEADMLLQQMKQQKNLPKSCSDGMVLMGRIDEENGEDEGSADHVFPRSRSYAVTKRSRTTAFS